MWAPDSNPGNCGEALPPPEEATWWPTGVAHTRQLLLPGRSLVPDLRWELPPASPSASLPLSAMHSSIPHPTAHEPVAIQVQTAPDPVPCPPAWLIPHIAGAVGGETGGMSL